MIDSAPIRVASSHRAPRPAQAAIACMIVLAVALGVGRFAFTPLLPLMLQDGLLDLRHGSWLASANYAGYVVGAVSCAALRLRPATVVRAGLVLTVVLTLAMSLAAPFWFWAAVRFVAGMASAWTFVFASQWGLARLAEEGAQAWSGVIYTGPGVGIVVTGLAASALSRAGSAAGWLVFGVASAAVGACVWRVFRQPAPGGPRARAQRSAQPLAGRVSPMAGQERANRREGAWLVLLYGIPGFGYIITATFLPVIARHALPPGSPWPDLFWPMFGAALIPGALAAARLPLAWDNRLMLAAAYLVEAAGIALGIVMPNAAGFAVGSILIGLPFTAITLFAMREARRLHGDEAAGLMGYATAAYGIGQIAGPLVAAPLAARAGSFSPSLWLAAGALTLGAIGLVARVWVGRKRV